MSWSRSAWRLIGAMIAMVEPAVAATPPLPQEVQVAIDDAEKQCDGRSLKEEEFITHRNIFGDGTPVYILRYEHLRCSDVEAGAKALPVAIWCGTAGCSTDIFVKVRLGFNKTSIVNDPKFFRKGRHLYMKFSGVNQGVSYPTTMFWDGHQFREVTSASPASAARP